MRDLAMVAHFRATLTLALWCANSIAVTHAEPAPRVALQTIEDEVSLLQHSLFTGMRHSRSPDDLHERVVHVAEKVSALADEISELKQEMEDAHEVVKDEALTDPPDPIEHVAKVQGHVDVTFLHHEKLGLTFDNVTGLVHVVSPGSQAERAGVKAGWRVEKIDGDKYSHAGIVSRASGSHDFNVTFSTKEGATFTKADIALKSKSASAVAEASPPEGPATADGAGETSQPFDEKFKDTVFHPGMLPESWRPLAEEITKRVTAKDPHWFKPITDEQKDLNTKLTKLYHAIFQHGSMKGLPKAWGGDGGDGKND